MYKVEEHFTYGWDDAGWSVDGKPMRFKTRKEAQAEIDDFIEDVRLAVADGYMDEAYDPESFRIVKTEE